jgi:hypothetical protein
MVFPRARAVVAGLLFVAWLGFLLHLVLASRHLIVLSRPQFLVATRYVVAEVQEADGNPAPRVKAEVVWAADRGFAEGDLDVVNLPNVGPTGGWQGPGKYILPLWKTPRGYAVPPTPPAPGRPFDEVRIYPLTPETRAQLDEIVASKS